MIKTVIVEDEEGPLISLRNQVKRYCPDLEVLGCARSSAEALDQIRTLDPGIVFLDIRLEDGNAFDLLDALKPQRFKVIFVTAHDEFAIKAFQYNATHFILKPLVPEELMEATRRVRKEVQPDWHELRRSLFAETSWNGRIAIPSVSKVTYVDVDRITHLESDGAYTYIHLVTEESVLSSRPLKLYDEMLCDKGFCRVHRSYLVHLSKVVEYRKGDMDVLVLEGGAQVEVSRKKRTLVLDSIHSL